MNERYFVVEQIVSDTHPYLSRDKILYKIKDNKTGHISASAFTRKEIADEIARKKNEQEPKSV